jgi:hypothetical protein
VVSIYKVILFRLAENILKKKLVNLKQNSSNKKISVGRDPEEQSAYCKVH